MSRQQNRYDRQFKLDTVEYYINSKKSMRCVANEFGVSDKTFYGWVQDYKKNGSQSFRGQGIVKASNEEVIALKRELADIKMERDILKKAAAIFLSTKK